MSSTRVLIVSGKGGVGKTTISAATALAAADGGYRTLVVSLDRAHNLGDVLQMKLQSTPVSVPDADYLQAMEIDPQAELDRNWSALQQYMNRFFRYLGADGITADELAVFPGLEELMVLTRLSDLAETGDYDLIVADMAPTASSLRYLSFPDMMDGILGKLVKWDERIATLFRPLQGKYMKMPMPEKAVYTNLHDLADRLRTLRDLLLDPSRAVVRLVMIPESIVLEETRRALTYLNLFGMTVESVIINRILSQEVTQRYFQGWGNIQARVMKAAAEGMAGLTIRTLPFQDTEVLGNSALRKTAKMLYGDEDPAAFMEVEKPFAYSQEGDTTVLTIRLPNGDGHGLDLRRHDRDLIITLNGWRRAITLPDSLLDRVVERARFIKGSLVVQFSTKTTIDS